MVAFDSLAYLKFTLPTGYQLEAKAGGALIKGRRPRRQIQISSRTFELLQALLAGEQVDCGAKELGVLLTLAAKSYIKITADAEALAAAIAEDPELVESLPFISVIIPVKNRPVDIHDCLESIFAVKWPTAKLEVIVVDDGSDDDTPDVAASLGARVVRRESSGGPSAARNAGAAVAAGDILAFIDSDCTVDDTWLLELVPWIEAPGIGALGGYVASFYDQTPLDRYEEAMSSLSMGKRLLYEAKTPGNFYVPTCNMLVQKSVYEEVGGLNPEMHLGEDVDLCWRVRNAGYGLVYVTAGRAWHKHRNALFQMMKRRLQYGTSEADLYKRHRNKKKLFPLPLNSFLFWLGLLLTIATFSPWFLAISAVGYLVGWCRKLQLSKRLDDRVGIGELFGVVWRSDVAFCYYLNFHLIRYYLLVMLIFGCFFPKLLLAVAIALISCSIVDYKVKKPRLNYFQFAFFYTMEQIYYQIGVLCGCFRHKYFKCYLVKWLFSI